MPYRDSSVGTPTWPGPGDDDAADFLNDVFQPFATDAKVSGGLGWLAQTPDGGAGGAGTHPNFQRMFSRGGVGTEAPPFINFQTTAKTLFMFSGDGVNLTQEPYDQPGNPMNQPVDALFSDPVTQYGLLKCLCMTTLVGPFSAYWLFGGPTGEYLHVVLKVGARQYRHFHVGMLTPFDTGLHADTFYITNHRWGFLGPDNLQGTSGSNTDSKEHNPYHGHHHLPFKNNNQTNIGFSGGWNGDVRSVGMWLYSPAYGSEAYDWWLMVGQPETPSGEAGSVLGRARASSGNFNNVTTITKTVGDVNVTPDGISFGAGWVAGYDKALGTILHCCEPTFTTDGVQLLPIPVLLPTDFETAIRWAPVGVVPDVFRVNMKSLDAEEEITIGSDTYTVFPMINKDSANTLANEGYSGYEGLAYKKITANAT